MRSVEIDYIADPASSFGRYADLDWAVLLDSGRTRCQSGRYDIFAAEPFVTLTTRGSVTEIRRQDGVSVSEDDPLSLLQDELGDAADTDTELPFVGGAIGYFAYDLGRRYERWDVLAADDIGMPDMAIGLYDWAVVTDHQTARSRVVGQGRDQETFERWDEIVARARTPAPGPRSPFKVLGHVTRSFDRQEYDRAFARIKTHIRDGNCYQVNLTQRFSAHVEGGSWDAYARLRDTNPAPFSAFLNFPFGQVMSSSPERFLHVRDGRVITQPIKGTRPRSPDAARDRELARELAASAKDRAENVMIVDLLRNDLGRNCAPGSIEATRLFDIESFANVHHLVSTVEGQLAPGVHALDMLRGAFPGGSITGAPKVRAMQIIEECEPQRRSVYCGAIGYVGFDGNMDTNIAIRTLLRSGDSVHAWAGSGIVADSDAGLEYQECFDKASGLLAVLAGSVISEAS